MDKQRLPVRSHTLRQRKLQTISIQDISDNLILVNYPYNVVLSTELLQHQDNLLQEKYHRYHDRLPQLLIQLDGIAELDQDCNEYLQSIEHQQSYDAVAFVLGKGNMSVLERHYLEQLFIYRSQRSSKLVKSHYPIGVFATELQARKWLSSNPGSNYPH